MKYKNLTLIGTSHIARESITQVKTIIEKEDPDIIALELDKPRIVALLNEGKRKGKFSLRNVFKIGLKGFLFSLIGEYVERKLGKMVGVKPGEEMMAAYNLAQERKKRVALIDQDIRKTLKRLSDTITWKEKFRFIGDVIMSLFKRKKIPFDLRTVPSEEIIKKMTDELKIKYPNVHKALIEERNEVMGNNLANLMMKFPEQKMVAVIGAGHQKELLEIIKAHISEKNIKKEK